MRTVGQLRIDIVSQMCREVLHTFGVAVVLKSIKSVGAHQCRICFEPADEVTPIGAVISNLTQVVAAMNPMDENEWDLLLSFPPFTSRDSSKNSPAHHHTTTSPAFAPHARSCYSQKRISRSRKSAHASAT